jgi:ABC-type nitrate/sulfonate/bicarbonate transport system permease component
VQIWSALVMAALLGLVLTGAVTAVDKWLTPGGCK